MEEMKENEHPCIRIISKVVLFQDTDVIVWDIVSEAGLFRLRGHKGEVTQCRFLTCRNVLITR